jgi:glycosyltransferase involved in cell wall biosynthesis
MKILFLCRLFYPHIGGVEKHVMEISKLLIKKGHTITIITEQYDNFLPRIETINGIKIYRIDRGENTKSKKFQIWKEMKRLQKVIQEADIVHCHDVFFWYLPFKIIYPGKPVYTTFHGYESFPIKKNAIRMRKLSEKLSSGNICIGEFIPKWYGTKATFISYGAVDIKELVSRFHGNDKLRGIKESAVFVGRLDEQTGALTYAKAIDLVKKTHPKFELVYIGDGEDREKIEKEYKVFGFQKDPEKYLLQYHFAFVSRYLSILEAFAAKRFVFAVYDNPVKEDYLKMAPYAKWIVIEKDSQRLAEKVTYYLNHPKEEEVMIEKAYKWVTTQTWEKMVNSYEKLWKNQK